MDDDTDDKDDTKRKTRNLSEKKRRDQFNLLINELSSMVSTNNRKMDKSTVLKSTISFLKNHNDIAVQSRASEIQEDWKPNFLTNEEFTHLFLEALDGFIIVMSSSGRILYTSESITSLLGYFPNDLMAMSVYDLVYEGDHSELYNVFLNPDVDLDENKENELCFTCHCKRGSAIDKEETSFEVVQFLGQFRSDVDSLQTLDSSSHSQVHQKFNSFSPESDTRWVFVGTGRLRTPQLIRELSVIDSTKSEFTSRHSLEWKFLFLDHRAPPIIGYLPFEVLGTSGYDYYHVDDLDKVVNCHEALMQKGEGTSCYYRFLTKGQQWIWLQTRFYITYHQWNSKPEFIVCTHRVVSYLNVLKQATGGNDSYHRLGIEELSKSGEKSRSGATARSSPWSSKSGASKKDKFNVGSDTNSLSADSPASKHSQHTIAPTRHSHAMGSVESGPVKTEKSSWHQPPSTTMDSGTVYPAGAQPPPPPPPPQQLQNLTPSTPVQGQPFAVVGTPTQPAAVLTTLSPQRVDLLEKRQEELQQRIVEQQTELRQVTEQLFFAKYGLFPPTVLNVPLQYAAVSGPTAPEMYMTDPHHHQVNPVSLHSENAIPLQQAQILTADTLFSPLQQSPANSTHSPCH